MHLLMARMILYFCEHNANSTPLFSFFLLFLIRSFIWFESCSLFYSNSNVIEIEEYHTARRARAHTNTHAVVMSKNAFICLCTYAHMHTDICTYERGLNTLGITTPIRPLIKAWDMQKNLDDPLCFSWFKCFKRLIKQTFMHCDGQLLMHQVAVE